MCVFGAVKLGPYFIVEYSFLGQEPWKFTSTLSGSEEDPLSSINATKQTELPFPPSTDVIKTDQGLLRTWAEPCRLPGTARAGASCSLPQGSSCHSLLLALIKLNTC